MGVPVFEIWGSRVGLTLAEVIGHLQLSPRDAGGDRAQSHARMQRPRSHRPALPSPRGPCAGVDPGVSRGAAARPPSAQLGAGPSASPGCGWRWLVLAHAVVCGWPGFTGFGGCPEPLTRSWASEAWKLQLIEQTVPKGVSCTRVAAKAWTTQVLLQTRLLLFCEVSGRKGP